MIWLRWKSLALYISRDCSIVVFFPPREVSAQTQRERGFSRQTLRSCQQWLAFMPWNSVYPKEMQGQITPKPFLGSLCSSQAVYLLWWLLFLSKISCFSSHSSHPIVQGVYSQFYNINKWRVNGYHKCGKGKKKYKTNTFLLYEWCHWKKSFTELGAGQST